MPGIMDHANQKVKPATDVPQALHCSGDICEESIKQDCISPGRTCFVRASETNAMRDCLKSKISQAPNAGYFQTSQIYTTSTWICCELYEINWASLQLFIGLC